MSRKGIRAEVVGRLLTGWPKGILFTLLPVTAGAMGAMVGVAFGLNPVVFFASVASMMTGTGVFVQRLLNGGPALVKEVSEEIERKEKAEADAIARQKEEEREQELDGLAEQLKGERDSRCRECLQNLRVLESTFRNHEQWAEGVSSSSTAGILENVRVLHESCLKALHRSVVLRETARQLQGVPRQKIERRREDLIQSIQKSVERLSSTVVEMQEMSEVVDQTTELESTGSQLDQRIEIARKVETEVKELRRVTSGTDSEEAFIVNGQ